MESYQKGLEIDADSEELQEGLSRCIDALNKLMRGQASEEELEQRREKAMADPEVQNILVDPIMRNVLRDFQENPKAAQQHLKDPAISAKLSKLVKAGIVRLG